MDRYCPILYIANDQSADTRTPSWVAFSDEERLAGDSAKNAYASNAANTLFDAKRLDSISSLDFNDAQRQAPRTPVLLLVFRFSVS